MNLKLKNLSSNIISNKPFIISGPCSAESQDQLLNTAIELKKINVDVFRAGVWKPRTRPNGFEGVGIPALEWLRNVKSETGLKVITEVANPFHLNKILENDIDMLWVGARTTGNPFAVQEIADAIKGIEIPVFIKNPLIPDVNLWVGAIERFYNSGIKNIVAIHRGFYNNISKDYRNLPDWNIPKKLKNIIPNLPLICDPSHIAGRKDLVGKISKLALDYDFDGLMIESHINPKSALTDQYQQLNTDELKALLKTLQSENIFK